MGLKPLSLKSLNDCLKTLFKDGVDRREDFSLYYKIHVHDQASAAQRGAYRFQSRNAERVVSCWCFNPGLAMLELAAQGVRNIILTSGTLSPLASTAAELKIPFPIRLENSHVIQPSQVWVGVLSNGPSDYPLNSSFKTRETEDYKQALGNALINFMRIVPNGLLVFFPSYTALTTCVDAWKRPDEQARNGSIWERMCRYKQAIIEPREAFQFKLAMEDYYAKVKTEGGAVFFAVCRGKVSEGLDFSDDNGRAVVITGLPFPSLTDAKVKQKRSYLDHQRQILGTSSLSLSGSDWYAQQAMRAVNQAVGRVIRHSRDHGAIILADQRFGMASNQSGLSLWLRPQVKVYNQFGVAALALTRFFNFFKNQKALAPPPPPKAKPTPRPKAQPVAAPVQMGRPASHTSPSKFVPPRVAGGAASATTARAPQATSLVPPRAGVKRERVEEPTERPAPHARDATSPIKRERGEEAAVTASEAQAYIRRVKGCLSPDEYKTFQSTLRDFRGKQIELAELMERVQQLFSGSQRYPLLRDFVAFVPPRHRATYLAMLPQEPTEDLPQPAASEERSPARISAPRPAQSPAQAERVPTPAAAYDLVSGSPCKPFRRPRPFASPLLPTTSTSTATTTPAAELKNEAEIAGTGEADAPTLPSDRQPSAPGEQSESTVCPVCQETASSPFAARCKHVCCYGCWKQWLQQKLECPVCKQRVRLKHLSKLYFCS